MDKDETLYPDELVAQGIRMQKTAGQRIKELDELIKKGEETIVVIEDFMMQEKNEEN